MSASLIKKGLKLFEADLKLSDGKQNKADKNNTSRSKVQGKFKSKQASLKDRKVKSALQKFAKKHVKEDRTIANLEILEKLSKTKPISSATVQTILQRRERRHQKPVEKKTGKSTVFTEEDFQKFEQEYFVNVK